MSISTGRGDDGKTSLFTGEQIDKDHIKVEAYGTIDELLSFVSEAKFYVLSTEVRNILTDIQTNLFEIASELASKKGKNFNKLKKFFLNKNEHLKIESLIHKYESIVKIKGFVLPGITLGSAKLDICRVITRRAERAITKLNKQEDVSTEIKKYINRLSDLFFILARFEEFIQDKIIYKE